MANGTNRAKFGARAIRGSAGKSKTNKKPFEKTQQVQKDLAGEIHKARVEKHGSNRAVSGSAAIRGSRGKAPSSKGAYGYEYTKQQGDWKKGDPNPFGKDAHGTASKTATTQKGKSTPLGVDVMKNPEGFEAEFQASGTGKAGDTFEAMKTPSKKKKRKLPQSLRSAGKTGKRRARAKARERVIEKNKTPGRTKETAKKIGKGMGKAIEKVKKVFKGKKKKPYIEKGRTKPRTTKQASAKEVINPDEFEAMYQASGKKKGK
tara:strand:+ start:216 stop:998 length:783 start_codon:yes stop_codon:yes gene_type:complete